MTTRACLCRCSALVSFVLLDVGQMNRAAHLYRPAPTVTDLSNTAEGMVRSANLKGYLQALARAYFEVYRRQIAWGQEDFWGLREFYSTIRSINRQLKRSQGGALNAATVMSAVQRNFGGRPEVLRAVLSLFFESLSMSMPEDTMIQQMVRSHHLFRCC